MILTEDLKATLRKAQQDAHEQYVKEHLNSKHFLEVAPCPFDLVVGNGPIDWD